MILLESHCAAARDTVQCLCVVKANPEPSVAFELPSRNVTVNESEREFVYSERSGLLLTSVLTLRGQAQAPPRVICTSRNLYGAKSLELPFQGAREWRGPPLELKTLTQLCCPAASDLGPPQLLVLGGRKGEGEVLCTENLGPLLPSPLRAPGSPLSSDRLMWAKIGPVGAVVAFAIIIAIVCYITQTRRK